jgi:hypothetical protein
MGGIDRIGDGERERTSRLSAGKPEVHVDSIRNVGPLPLKRRRGLDLVAQSFPAPGNDHALLPLSDQI